jgi:hypothetical protein
VECPAQDEAIAATHPAICKALNFSLEIFVSSKEPSQIQLNRRKPQRFEIRALSVEYRLPLRGIRPAILCVLDNRNFVTCRGSVQHRDGISAESI